jgi:hypothetical protein
MRTVRLLPKQLMFIADERKVVGARGGIGSGKTFCTAWWLIKQQAEYPQASFGAIGASFTQLHKGFFKTLKGLCDAYKIQYRYTISPRPTLKFIKTGAVVESLSAEQREQIRSLEMDFVAVEEPQTWESGQETFTTLVGRLRPSPSAIANYPGLLPKIRLTFNPPPVGHWLYELFEKQWAGIYPCYRMSLWENVIHRRIDPSYLPFQLETIPQERHAREIEGHWGTLATGVYRGFDAARNTIEGLRAACPQEPIPPPLPPFALDPSKKLRWSLDFNVAWMASTISQLHAQPKITRFVSTGIPGNTKRIEEPTNPAYQSRVLYVLDEIFLPDSAIQNVVAEFIRRYGDFARKSGLVIYGDASGGGRSQTVDSNQSARSVWAILRRELKSARIDFEWKVQRSNPPVMDRIDAVREWFNTNGRVGLVTSTATCKELVNDFNLVQFVPGKNEIDKRDTSSEEGKKRTHQSDNIGYLCWVETQLDRGGPPPEWSLVR